MSGRTSIDIIWRSASPTKPARFIVSFYDAHMIIEEQGYTPEPVGYHRKDSPTVMRPMQDFGEYTLKGEHQNFLDCMMMAKVKDDTYAA